MRPLLPTEFEKKYEDLLKRFPEDAYGGESVECMPVAMWLYVEAGLTGEFVIDYIIKVHLAFMNQPNQIVVARSAGGRLEARSTAAFERDFNVKIDVALHSDEGSRSVRNKSIEAPLAQSALNKRLRSSAEFKGPYDMPAFKIAGEILDD